MSPAPQFPDPDDPAYHPTAPELQFPWLPRRRWGLIAGVSAGVLLVLLGCLRAWLSSDGIRERVMHALTSRIDGVKVGDRYSVDWLGRVTLGPVTLDGVPGQPAFEVDTMRIRPSYRALLAGHAEAASVRFGQAVLDVGDEGKNLPALAHRLKHRHGESAAGSGSGALPLFLVDRLELRGNVGGLGPVALAVSEVRLEVSRGSDGRQFDARARLGQGDVSLHLVHADQGPIAVSAQVRDVGPEAIPSPVRARFPFLIDGGRFSGTAETIASGLGRGALRVSAKVQALTLEGARLAEAPVGPLALSFDGDWRWNAANRRVTLERGTLSIGAAQQVKAELSGDVQMRGEAHFMAAASVEQLAYRDALEALPSALQPPPEAPRLTGALSAAVTVSGPLRSPDDWKVDAKLDLSKLEEEARQPFFLREPFTFHYADAAGHDAELLVGPKNPSFVPIAELPAYVYRAVTTSEDGGFFGHHGFDFDELKNSIVADREAGRAVRGGSTITQQLAKNLFLTREKTYARKLREALITIGLEASLSKQRMLEIYLNVIEWGPGIRGIGPASQHYFGKDARELTPKEAAFLATIIPNPIRFHVYYERGALTDNWDRRVEDVLEKMFAVGIITEDQFDTARDTPLEFTKPPERQVRPREGRSQLR